MRRIPISDIELARAGLDDAVMLTPCSHSQTLSQITGANVWCKFENMQYTSSFKERGARWLLLSLDDASRRQGVVAASAGNHAQGVAYHARLLGIPATIVMPVNTPFSKVTRTEIEGARVELFGNDFSEAYARAQELSAKLGATFVPAFDHPLIVAGAGTVALEVLEQVPDVEMIVVPVGGGGLISGIASAVNARAPHVRVVGVQSETHPQFAAAFSGNEYVSDKALTTIAEGIAVKTPGELPLAICRELVEDVLVVGEEMIEKAVAYYLEIEKLVVEGAGAASLAALLAFPELFANQRCTLIVSGGNIDLRVLSSVVLHALASSGRLVRYRCLIADLPGQLAHVANIIGNARGNIVDVEHHRDRHGVAVRDAILEVSVETRDANHAAEIGDALIAGGITLLDGDN